jgi:hypothetical protein
MKNFIHDPHDSDPNSPIHVLKEDNMSWCGLLYAFWEEVPDEKLQATARHCVKCHQNWQASTGLAEALLGCSPELPKDKFVLVSSKGLVNEANQPVDWSYVSPDFMLCRVAGTMRYDEVKYFLETSEIGSFIPVDNDLLFKVTPK